jgi:hypothetical protein
MNPLVATTQLPADEATLLFTFRGSISHPLRRNLMDQAFAGLDKQLYTMTHIDKWFTHDETDKLTYAQELQRSRFVLCPRGCGTASHRIFETMASRRVPVIISDDWLAPAGLPWSDFSLIVSEDRLADLPSIIQSVEPRWKEMGSAAREAWDGWFSPETGPHRILQMCAEIQLARPATFDERDWQERWTSWTFAYSAGWTIPQRVFRKVRRITTKS